MNAFSYEPAIRRAVRPLIALAGPSGSGKTLSALLIARGFVGPDGKIVVIDTENRRSEMYADDPDVGGFFIKPMYPPFTSQSFQDAIDEAENSGADAVVVDSMSHEWNGIGGCVEQAEMAQIRAKKDGPWAWIKPKRSHLRMMNRIGQTQIPVFFCLRTKPQFITEKDERGKQSFAKGPEVAEQESRFIYEMTLAALLEHDTHKAFYSHLKELPRPLHGVLVDGERITVETGRAIKAWVAGGEVVDTEFERQASILRDLASLGTDALAKHWSTIAPAMQKRLAQVKDDCKAIAGEADRIDGDMPEAEREPEDDPFEATHID